MGVLYEILQKHESANYFRIIKYYLAVVSYLLFVLKRSLCESLVTSFLSLFVTQTLNFQLHFHPVSSVIR